MNADELARRCIRRLKPVENDAQARAEVFVDMLRACREYVPAKLLFTDEDLARLERDRAFFEGRRHRTPLPYEKGSKDGELADMYGIEIEQLHARRAIWAAFCAFFDATEDQAAQAAAAELGALIEAHPDAFNKFYIRFGPNEPGVHLPEYQRYREVFWSSWKAAVASQARDGEHE